MAVGATGCVSSDGDQRSKVIQIPLSLTPPPPNRTRQISHLLLPSSFRRYLLMSEHTAFLVLLTSACAFLLAVHDRNGHDEGPVDAPVSKRFTAGLTRPNTVDSSALRAAIMNGLKENDLAAVNTPRAPQAR